MSKHLVRLAAAALALSASAAHAATVSNNLTVTANVANNCTVSTGTLGFGAYDPVVANASADLDSSGTVAVQCTKGTTYTVTLDAGANSTVVGTATVRQMSSGADFLAYELYTTSGRTTVWDTSTTPPSVTASSKAPNTITIYGRIPANQDVSAGSYTDTVSATVNY